MRMARRTSPRVWSRSLEKEGVAYDVGHYRDAPSGLRIWAGATIETADMQKLMPWLSWAFETQKATLSQAAARDRQRPQAPPRGRSLHPELSACFHAIPDGKPLRTFPGLLIVADPILQEASMAPRVLVSDELSETAVQIFRDRGVEVDFQPQLGKDKDKLLEIIGNYDGLAIRSATKVTEKIIEAAANLKVVGRAGIGVDNVDIPAASRRGIIVMNTPFGNSITTAEHAIALMFAVARQLPSADASTQAGKWEKSKFMGVEITGKTLGVIGAGNIGSIVIARAIGLKMHVVAYDPFLSRSAQRKWASSRSN